MVWGPDHAKINENWPKPNRTRKTSLSSLFSRQFFKIGHFILKYPGERGQWLTLCKEPARRTERSLKAWRDGFAWNPLFNDYNLNPPETKWISSSNHQNSRMMSCMGNLGHPGDSTVQRPALQPEHTPGRPFEALNSLYPRSNIKILDLQGVLFNELTTRLDVVTHQGGEQVIGGGCIVKPDL